MKEAKIEIRSRDIFPGKSINPHALLDENADFGDPDLESFWYRSEEKIQHLFIIYTDSQGQEIILRGGPESKNQEANLKEVLFNNIKITYTPYIEDGYDWVDSAKQKLPSVLIARGTDAQMQALIDKIWQRGQEINAGKFDYKLPTPGCSEALCHVQNSNTVVRELVKAAGLQFELPKINGVPVQAPGINGKFKHTPVDKKIKEYFDGPHSDSSSPQPEDASRDSSFFGGFQAFFGWRTESSAASPAPPTSAPQPKADPWQKTWRFDQKLPYDLNVPAWDAHLIDEPLWLYTPPSYSSYSKTAEDPMKGFHLLRDMKREVQNCLGNPACTDTTERLIHKVLLSRPELKDPTVLHGDLKQAAQEAAAGFSDTPQGDPLFNLLKTSELGRWAHPLREELKYAASHVKDRCTTASSESTLRRAVLKILMYLHVHSVFCAPYSLI